MEISTEDRCYQPLKMDDNLLIPLFQFSWLFYGCELPIQDIFEVFEVLLTHTKRLWFNNLNINV